MDITVEHVSKSYDGLVVLEDFSFSFPEGKTTCIMGESGCGKTTLLHMILGIVKPDCGQIAGVPYGRLSAVFQEDRLCENLSAKANIRLVCRGKADDRKISRGMEAVRLTDACHKPVKELSGGMRRRVAILRALFADAECIVMDEPLKGLDEETKAVVLKVIREYTEGKTLLVVTHDREEPRQFGAAAVLALHGKKTG